ncbi:MAG: DUF1800 domain-containing protein, partial [Armatimonadota bacterium]|nr:DUF1800 domain-containing protein [Armatimonadota bacterium]
MTKSPLSLRTSPLVGLAAASLLSTAVIAWAGPPAKATAASSAKPLQGDQKIQHALNRLTFGPRPGDLERVREMGLGRWIEQQLNPATIDDTAVEAKLSRLTTLTMPSNQLLLAYAADTTGFIKKLDKQKKEEERAARRNRNGNKAEADTQANTQKVAMTEMELNPRQRRLLEMIEKANLPRGSSAQAVGELNVAKLVRAAESKRQLQEVLVDFWSNHFNVDVRKGPVRSLKIVDDREVIRPHVLGSFRELLGASAKSPAMLFYLDNVRSTAEMQMPQRGRRGRFGRRNVANQNVANPNNAAPKKRGGLNENYARELMELHTLGVDGGYTQQDVQEVARCLTGWGMERETGAFRFYPFLHDNGEKTVLGQKIPAGGGIRDGEMVLDILASHPSTARFIAQKLCVRFVADEPPAALVD